MGHFWDKRAREDAMFFVDDREPYGNADEERFWEQGERDLDHVLGKLGARIEEGDAVVDLGCGVGRLTRVIAQRADEVYALDVSKEMLAQARQHNAHLDNVEWVQGDGTTLQPIPDQAADAVISHVVFQHIPDPKITYGYVAEIGRVLRPGGWAAFQVSDDPAIHQATQSLGEKAKAAVGRAPKGQDEPEWLGSAIDMDELEATANKAHLKFKHVEGEGTQFCLILARRHGF
jgi:ubiquinone/menaquinone biosynthesis C-methylase UbiE